MGSCRNKNESKHQCVPTAPVTQPPNCSFVIPVMPASNFISATEKLKDFIVFQIWQFREDHARGNHKKRAW